MSTTTAHQLLLWITLYYSFSGISPTESNNSEADNGVPSTHTVDDDERHQICVPAAYQAMHGRIRRPPPQGATHVETCQ